MVTTLYDKYIHFTLMETNLPGPNDRQIRTPLTGRKPQLNLKGSLLPAYNVAQIEVRATNFYTDIDLGQYKYAKVEAGYFGAPGIAFEGALLLSYLEKPSPDSVTVFPMVLGNYSVYSDSVIVKEWVAGTGLRTILTEVANSMGMILSYDAEDYIIEQKVISEGRTKDFINKLTRMLPNLRIQFDSKRLIVYNTTKGRSDFYTIDKIAMAVKKGEALTLTGPWIPTMRPGDIAKVDPFFYKQSIGSTFVPFKTDQFIINVIDFSFGTIEGNSMITHMINKGEEQELTGE